MPEDAGAPALPPDAAERIADAVRACEDEIARAAATAGRDGRDVALLAVTKYVPGSVIRLLHRAGLRRFGESRVQRARAVSRELADLEGIEWHLIGHLQRNKVRQALACCRVVHSVDSLRLAEEITTRRRPAAAPAAADSACPGPLAVFVELALTGESSKTGLPLADGPRALEHLAEAARDDPGLRVAGLMGMAPLGADPEDARPFFRRLRELRDGWIASGLLPPDAGLSMGMSHDFAVAIEEGATVVRVGRRLLRSVLEP